MIDRNEGMKNWTIRRRFMWMVNLFCMGCVSYITYKGTDSRTAETIVQGSFFTITATLSSYVFGAAWQDISFKRSGND